VRAGFSHLEREGTSERARAPQAHRPQQHLPPPTHFSRSAVFLPATVCCHAAPGPATVGGDVWVRRAARVLPRSVARVRLECGTGHHLYRQQQQQQWRPVAARGDGGVARRDTGTCRDHLPGVRPTGRVGTRLAAGRTSTSGRRTTVRGDAARRPNELRARARGIGHHHTVRTCAGTAGRAP